MTDPDRFSEAIVLRTALHVEGFDLSRETTQQDGLVNGVGHQALRGFWDILQKSHNNGQI